MRHFKVVIPSRSDSNIIECVKALKCNEPNLTKYDIIIVDDGAHTVQSDHLQVTWIQGVKPFIFARNVNIGMSKADCDVFVENDDTRLQTPHGFSKIADLSYQHPDYGVLSPSLTSSWNPLLMWKLENIRDIEDDFLSFVCPFIPKHSRTLIGWMDERFDGYGREDVDYCHRMHLSGLRTGVFGGVSVEHMVLPSQWRDTELGLKHKELNERAHALYSKKWDDYIAPTRDVIQSLWVGSTLSTMEQISIKSFLAHGHPFHLYTYNYVNNVPSGVVIKDASDIIPYSDIARFQNLQNFSDWFRYNLVLKAGNWWVDLDTVCLRPFDFTGSIVVSEEGWTKSPVIPSSPFKAPAGSDLVKFLVDEASKIDQSRNSYCALGPELMTKAVMKFSIPWQPARTFNPIPVSQFNKFIDPSGFEFTEGNYACHMHHATWTHFNKMNVDAIYNQNCLYEWLKRRYGVNTMLDRPVYTNNNDLLEDLTFTPQPVKLGPVVFRDGKRVQLDSRGNVL